ncbi:MAG TPA: flagellar basal body FlgE domain-containing protein [Myxococcota bacterium]|nr:flagellar basal body FlgE domain-containing protein [Myxococcota bacterium]
MDRPNRSLALCLALVLGALPSAASDREGKRRLRHDRVERTVRRAATPRCHPRPTRRLDLVVNLDADTPATPFAGMGIDVPAPFRSVVTVHDRDAEPRELSIEWHREAEPGTWTISIGPVSAGGEDADDATSPTSEAWVHSTVHFDSHGRLLEPRSLSVPLRWADDGTEDSREKQNRGRPGESEHTIEVALSGPYGASTQFFQSSLEWAVEDDGAGCPEHPRTRRVCRLDPSWAALRPIEDVGSIHLTSRGRLTTSAYQRVQGHRFDLETGVRAEAPSDVLVPNVPIPPRATESIRLVFELDADGPILPGSVDPVRSDRAFPIPVTTFDSLGRSHSTTLRVARSGPSHFTWAMTTPIPVHEPDVGSIGAGSPRASASLVNAFFSVVPPSVIEELLDRPPGFKFVSSDPGFLATHLPRLEIATQGPVFSNAPLERVLGRGTFTFDEEGLLAGVEVEGLPMSPGMRPILPAPMPWDADPEQSLELDAGLGTTRMGETDRVLETEQDGHAAGTIASLFLSEQLVLVATASSGIAVPLAELAFAEAGEPICAFACSNGRDDDGDGRTDHPEDPGCRSPLDDAEQALEIACDDGRDNDGDGLIDHPADPGCLDPADDDESPVDEGVHPPDRRRRPYPRRR